MLKKSKLASAIATGTLLLNAFAPTAFAGTDLVISDNGPLSNNTVNLVQTTTTNVVQNNDANVTNNVNSTASTGGNNADFNNGGNVRINTGNANTTTNVSTSANQNVADVNGCCEQGTNVTVSNNGPLSDNDANVTQVNSVGAFQNNTADVNNNVNSTAKTGYNSADFNNGGNVTVNTGSASTNTTVRNNLNSNLLNIGNGPLVAGTGLSVRILDNGPLSDNDVNLVKVNALTAVQNNVANVWNNVNSTAKTGNNSADFNNGGDVVIHTGNANASTLVDNMVNFNAADLDCGCVVSGLAKIAGNGPDSDSDINAVLTDFKTAFQTNGAYLNNNADSDAKTGKNNAGFNNAGGLSGADPSIHTGNATEDTTVRNNSNTNVIGPSTNLPLPGGTTLNLNWNLGVLWSLLHLV